MVVDTSAILALFFNETHAGWVADTMQLHSAELRMSTVNLAETLVRLEDRQPQFFDHLRDKLLSSGIRFVAPDVNVAKIAATARLMYPINFGDCFAYALATSEGVPILSLDPDFRKTDCRILFPS